MFKLFWDQPPHEIPIYQPAFDEVAYISAQSIPAVNDTLITRSQPKFDLSIKDRGHQEHPRIFRPCQNRPKREKLTGIYRLFHLARS
jgi:hypothetical protein